MLARTCRHGALRASLAGGAAGVGRARQTRKRQTRAPTEPALLLAGAHGERAREDPHSPAPSAGDTRQPGARQLASGHSAAQAHEGQGSATKGTERGRVLTARRPVNGGRRSTGAWPHGRAACGTGKPVGTRSRRADSAGLGGGRERLPVGVGLIPGRKNTQKLDRVGGHTACDYVKTPALCTLKGELCGV